MHAGALEGVLQAIGLVLSSASAVYFLHVLLSYLPLCFTVGGHLRRTPRMQNCRMFA